MEEKIKNILISGGAGFIGSHLANYLVSKGHKVFALDNLSTGRKKNLSDKVVFIRGNVENASKWNFNDWDEIYHLASPASPIHFEKMPLAVFPPNSIGTVKILRYALKKLERDKHKVKVLFTSTSEVYGDPKEHPQKETYTGDVDTLSVRAVYDESKRFGEMVCGVFARRGVDVRIARIFNTFGPNMPKDGRVFTNFLDAIQKKRSLIVHGNGMQTRSFMYISDCIKGLMLLMGKGKVGEAYNLGNPEEATIIELARLMMEYSKYDIDFTFGDARPNDPKRRLPDISKIRELGFEPQVSYKDGIKSFF